MSVFELRAADIGVDDDRSEPHGKDILEIIDLQTREVRTRELSDGIS